MTWVWGGGGGSERRGKAVQEEQSLSQGNYRSLAPCTDGIFVTWMCRGIHFDSDTIKGYILAESGDLNPGRPGLI